MLNDKQRELKKHLWQECFRLQSEQVQHARTAMELVQESANEHNSSMEDKFESFRENCHIQRDMYAKQLDEALSGLLMIKRIVPTAINNEVMLGSIVKTDQHNYFIASSLGQMKFGDETFFVISPLSPIFKAMANKVAGEEFQFRDKKFKIKELC